MLERWRTELKDEDNREPSFDSVIQYLSGKKNVEINGRRRKQVVRDTGPAFYGFNR